MSDSLLVKHTEINALPTQRERIDTLNAFAKQLENEDTAYGLVVAQDAYEQCTTGEFALAPYTEGLVQALLNLASLYEMGGNYKRSVQYANEALTLAEQESLPTHLISAYYLLAWNYYNLGDNVQSMSLAVKQLDLAQRTNQLLGQANAHNILGTILGATDDSFAQSVEHYQKSFEIYQVLGSREDQAVLLNNLCITYESEARYSEATTFGEKAVALSRDTHQSHTEALALGNLGVVYSKQGQYDQALTHYQLRLKISVQNGYRTLEAHTLLNLGRLYRYLVEFDTAIDYLQQALALSEALDNRRWMFESHQQLAIIYEARGNFAEALNHYKQFHVIEHDFTNETIRTKVEQLKLIHDIEQVQNDLAQERAKHEQDRRYFEQINLIRDQLLNTASHDLKNPLSSINLNLHLLGYHLGDSDPRIQTLLNRLRHSADRMEALITQLLDKALLESAYALDLKTVGLDAFIKDVVADVSESLAAKHLELSVQSTVLTVKFDPDRMRQVLNNLLSNAIKYTLAGGQIKVGAETQEAELTISVQDTGLGIPAEALPHLFQDFYRVDTPEHRAVEGTGLGLSIVKSIIDHHHGSIHVDSEIGIGTTIKIMLPNAVVV